MKTFVTLLLLGTLSGPALGMQPVGLRTAGREHPLAVATNDLSFSWFSRSGDRSEVQTAYQIIVPGYWDSGKVPSEESLKIPYAGKPLGSGIEHQWKVRVWDRNDRASEWSKPAAFTTAPAAWSAQWIAARDYPMNPPLGQRFTPAPNTPGVFTNKPSPRREGILMRREVMLAARPVRALAHVAGMGFVKLRVNDSAASDRAMAPALTDFTRRAYYDTCDITAWLRRGSNTFGLLLGNGYFASPGRGWGKWYGVGNEPVASLQIEMIYADGSRQTMGTDAAWKWSTGEITFNDFFAGESQDLRLAQTGWDKTGFNDAQWKPIAVVSSPPGQLQPNPCSPIRACEEVRPIQTESNRYTFDSMYAGWPLLKVKGVAGQKVRVESFVNYDFILSGRGEETLEPQFMVHSIGPSIQVDGAKPRELRIKWAHADLRRTGGFQCSNPFLNDVHAAFVRTHLNYTYDFPMDPTREKTGWTQDVQTMFDSASLVTDMEPVYRRWWTDLRDNQTANGAVGSVAPMVWGGQDDIWNDPWWGGMIVYTPWKLYQYYGDQRVLEEGYESMAAYLDWLSGKASPDGLLRWAGASDWIEVGIDGWGPPKRTPTYLVSTCGWYLYADILRRTAEVLGKPDEAQKYAGLAARIRTNFNSRCLDAITGIYAGATNSQTALILPLALGMVPEGKRSLVVERLQENIHQWNDHLNTGFVGTPYLLESLTELGLAELSYRIVTQQDYPGWKTLITDGVMKETWRGGMAQMPSLGGSVGQWFYKTLAGIQPAEPGFKRMTIQPRIVGDLTWVKAWHDSPYGRVISEWEKKGTRLTLRIGIPPNTRATIILPCRDIAAVRESGKSFLKSRDIRHVNTGSDGVVLEVGSGDYRFTAEL